VTTRYVAPVICRLTSLRLLAGSFARPMHPQVPSEGRRQWPRRPRVVPGASRYRRLSSPGHSPRECAPPHSRPMPKQRWCRTRQRGPHAAAHRAELRRVALHLNRHARRPSCVLSRARPEKRLRADRAEGSACPGRAALSEHPRYAMNAMRDVVSNFSTASLSKPSKKSTLPVNRVRLTLPRPTCCKVFDE